MASLNERIGQATTDSASVTQTSTTTVRIHTYSASDWAVGLERMYIGADKSLARSGRKQATATKDFDVHVSYL